jgi:hypothetical protein
MNFTKVIGAVVSGLLVLGGAVGIPGLDSPHASELAEKLSGTLGALLGGWLFLRQEWLGQGKPPLVVRGWTDTQDPH